MERRAEPRFPADRTVRVTVLGQPEKVLEGVITDASGGGLRLILPEATPLEAAIRIDLQNAMVLGEVSHCTPHEGGFAVGVRICHSLVALDRLAKLRARFLHDRSTVALT